MTDVDTATPEIMPSVTTALFDRRTLWVEHLRGDRHHDMLYLDPVDGDTLSLSEAQARDLHAKLGAHIASWDEQDQKGSRRNRS